MLTIEEGRKLAEQYVADKAGSGYEVFPGSFREAGELFVFNYNKKGVSGSDSFGFGVVGQGPTVIDRLDGRIHAFGSAYSSETALQRYRQLKLAWAPVAAAFPFFDFDSGYYSLVISEVKDKKALVEALASADLTYVVPEVSGGIIWRVAQAYTPELLEQRLTQQPTRFDGLRPNTVMALFPQISNGVCAFDLQPYEPKPREKYEERAGPADYEPLW